MYSSTKHFHCAGHGTAPVLCACCMVSVLSFSGCSDEAQPAMNDNGVYPEAVPAAGTHSSPSEDNNCIEDDFC